MVHTTMAGFLTRERGLLLGVGLLAALVLVAILAPRSRAATIQVTTTADLYDVGNPGGCGAVLPGDLPGGGDGQISLREALCAANNRAGADTITFAAGTDGTPIVLAGTVGEDANAGGDLDILAGGGDLTVRGNGAGVTLIDGDLRDRVFHVCPGGACSIRVTLDGVAIRRGSADFGGGILNQGATLNVQDSAIGGPGVGNTASDEGGGIENQDGTTTVDGTTISANRAESGGGICNHATLNIQNSTIGGAGASNRAENGGGIYNDGGTTTLEASTVISNTATDGGGIYHNAGTTMVAASTVVSNTATDDGGGIYVQDGTTTVTASTISANVAADAGGGIYNHATLNVQDSAIGGAGASNRATYGGGLRNFAGQATVDGSTISGNKAVHGGGIYNHYAAALTVQNGSVVGEAGAGNTATAYGGGIYNGSGGTTTVDASSVVSNTAFNGGGIYNEGTLTVWNGSTIGGSGGGNRATVNGGGVYNGTGGTTTVAASTVVSNTADSGGGGIFNWFGTTTVEGSTVISNTAGAVGGGINNYYGATTVDGCTVRANAAPSGGGIYNHATLNVTNSTIGGAGGGNRAVSGGGLHNWFGTTTVEGSTISANTAKLGGGIYNDAISTAAAAPGSISAAATLTVQNSTIGGVGAGNTATEAGGGIYNGYEFTMQVMDSRILYNTAPNGGGVFSWNEFVGATSVTGSCIVGNSDTSFFNDKTAQQTATGNWWGAVGGPNAPGADTVGGPVDTSGFLNTPILGCAPELQVDKSNDTGGNGAVATPFNWTLTIANAGVMDATFYAGQRILDDDLPAGPTYGAPVTGGYTAVTNSANIGCSITSNTLTCEAIGANVTIAAATGSFDVVLPVTPGAIGTLSNPAGNCRVDPDGQVLEADEGNNNCPADTVDVGVLHIYLPLVARQ